MVAGAIVVQKSHRNGPRYEIIDPDVDTETMRHELGYVLRSRGHAVATMKVRQIDDGSISFVNKNRFDTAIHALGLDDELPPRA